MHLAQGTQWARGLVALLLLISYGMQYQLIRHVQQGGTLAPGSGSASDSRVETLEYIQAGVMLLAVVALALWAYRAYHNAHQLPWPVPATARAWPPGAGLFRL